jgi:hypothetical protein
MNFCTIHHITVSSTWSVQRSEWTDHVIDDSFEDFCFVYHYESIVYCNESLTFQNKVCHRNEGQSQISDIGYDFLYPCNTIYCSKTKIIEVI